MVIFIRVVGCGTSCGRIDSHDDGWSLRVRSIGPRFPYTTTLPADSPSKVDQPVEETPINARTA
jgi:hypothetical protein